MSVVSARPATPVALANQSTVADFAMPAPKRRSWIRRLLRPVALPILRVWYRVTGHALQWQIAEMRMVQEDLLAALLALQQQGRAASSALLPRRRLVWVSSWQTRCGIAEYSRCLLAGVLQSGPGWRTTVLRDQRPISPQIEGLAGVAARPGFALNDASSVQRLALGIMAEEADCVVIQHHAGLLDWHLLAALLMHPALSARRVVVELHNTLEIVSLAEPVQARLRPALQRADRLLVHTPRDLALLRSLGITTAHMLVHGCPPSRSLRVPRALPPAASPLIGTTGFLMPHKGFQALIAAVAELRAIWPAIRLRMVTSRHASGMSEAEHIACLNLAHRLGFNHHIDWQTGFATQDQMIEALAPCDLLVLPYGDTQESCSGAARQALSSAVPTLVSDQPIFDDLGDAVCRFAVSDASELAGEIEGWLQAPLLRAQLQQRQAAWCARHEWASTGEHVARILDQLVPADGRLSGDRLSGDAFAAD